MCIGRTLFAGVIKLPNWSRPFSHLDRAALFRLVFSSPLWREKCYSSFQWDSFSFSMFDRCVVKHWWRSTICRHPSSFFCWCILSMPLTTQLSTHHLSQIHAGSWILCQVDTLNGPLVHPPPPTHTYIHSQGWIQVSKHACPWTVWGNWSTWRSPPWTPGEDITPHKEVEARLRHFCSQVMKPLIHPD